MFFRKYFERDEHAAGANRAEHYVREVWRNIKQTQPRKIVPIFKTCPSWENEAVSGPGLTLLPLPCFIPRKLCKTVQDSISFLFVRHGFRFGRKYSCHLHRVECVPPLLQNFLLANLLYMNELLEIQTQNSETCTDPDPQNLRWGWGFAKNSILCIGNFEVATFIAVYFKSSTNIKLEKVTDSLT